MDYSAFPAVIHTLSEAIAAHHLCRVHYQVPYRPDPRAHLVAPLTLLAHRDSLYLRCHHAWPDGELKPDYDAMLLAVHRIVEVEATDKAFLWVEKKEPAGFGIMNREPVRVRVAFRGWAADHVREREWSEDQVVEVGEDGRMVLEFTAKSAPEVMGWVLGFGPEAELLEPPELRDQASRALLKAAWGYTTP